jgi:hypothetical protein
MSVAVDERFHADDLQPAPAARPAVDPCEHLGLAYSVVKQFRRRAEALGVPVEGW